MNIELQCYFPNSACSLDQPAKSKSVKGAASEALQLLALDGYAYVNIIDTETGDVLEGVGVDELDGPALVITNISEGGDFEVSHRGVLLATCGTRKMAKRLVDLLSRRKALV